MPEPTPAPETPRWAHHPAEAAEALPEQLAHARALAAATPLDRDALAEAIAVAREQAAACADVLAAEIARMEQPDPDGYELDEHARRWMAEVPERLQALAAALDRAHAYTGEGREGADVDEALAVAEAVGVDIAGEAEDAVDVDAYYGGEA